MRTKINFSLPLDKFFKPITSLNFQGKISHLSSYLQNHIEKFTIERDSEGEIVQQSPVWIRSTVIGMMGSAVFALGWLALARTDEVVSVSGKLQPLGQVKDIQMPLGGIASEILVQDGDEVKMGQALMKLDAETSQKRVIALEQLQKLKLRQLELKETELEKFILQSKEKINFLQRSLSIQQEVLRRYEYLSQEGAAANLDTLRQTGRVDEIVGQIKQANIEQLRQEAILFQQIQQLKADLEDIESKSIEALVNLRYQVLRSPVDGIVFDLQPKSEGYVAQGTESVMKIVPYDNLEANIEIPSNKIGFIKVGMPVEISIDSFPARDFGILNGEVKSIGSDALPPSQLDNRPEYRFPAIIELESQKLIFRGNKKLPLQVGMSLTSNIKLRKVSYLQLLLGTFQEKVDSLGEL